MTYETAVSELVRRFPELRDQVSERMEARELLPNVAFGSIVIPRLKEALTFGDLSTIVRMCAYLEDIAVDSPSDPTLAHLLRVEIGEWLSRVAHEELLTPWLGPETKRICGYAPGLATQRRLLKEEKARQSLWNRLKRLFSRQR